MIRSASKYPLMKSCSSKIFSSDLRVFYSAQPLQDDIYDDEFPRNHPSYQRIHHGRSSIQLNLNRPSIHVGNEYEKDTNPLSSNLNRVLLKNEGEKKHKQGIMTVMSPCSLRYSGEKAIPITSTLHLVRPGEDTPRGTWPVFRLMDQDGYFRNPAFDGSDHKRYMIENPKTGNNSRRRDLLKLRNYLKNVESPYQASEIDASGLLHSNEANYTDISSTNTLWRVYRQIVRLREMDSVLLNAQRQGRISFYMTCTGEEAIHMGAASALEVGDPILAQYREQGVLMWRGFTLEQFTNQCLSNDKDLGKGRQMPIHYGSQELNYHTISSPLGTQLPQAVGVAYRLKLMNKPNVAITFFGEGCASTTDFHSAMNFAAALHVPCIFFCRNNGYAISTPSKEQYAGDGIVSRGPGYGMASVRVDGNDVFAVHAAVREAKKYAIENSAPVLIEALTYRIGHHSTSDDSTAYRDVTEVQNAEKTADPLLRLQSFLQRHEWLNTDEINTIKNEERKAVLQVLQEAERRPKTSLDEMFEDVYFKMPENLKEQKSQLLDHIAKYPQRYK